MAKQSIFGRIVQLARANISTMLNSAKDPQKMKMTELMVHDYKDTIADAEKAIAQAVDNLRLLQDDYRINLAAAESWNKKAIAASDKAYEAHTGGDFAAAQKFDDLTKLAIQGQIKAENESRIIKPSLQKQEEIIEQLKVGLNQMKAKLNELNNKWNQFVTNAKTVQIQRSVYDVINSPNLAGPNGEAARPEEKIRRKEDKIGRTQTPATLSPENQIISLEGIRGEVEARFAALKARNNSGQAAAPAGQLPTSEATEYASDAPEFEAERELRIDYDATEES